MGKIKKVDFYKIKNYLLTKKIRSSSGITEIAIMTSPGDFSCAYDCYYCPNQEGMPAEAILKRNRLLKEQHRIILIL